MSCDVETRRNFRLVANAIAVGIVLSTISIAISILVMINYFMPSPLFSFLAVLDPPYLGIISGVLLILFIAVIIALKKIKNKTCESLELPLN